MKKLVLKKCFSIALLSVSSAVFSTQSVAQTISTYAGTAVAGYTGDGGMADTATFRNPQCVYFDLSGNMYIADGNNSCIRKITTAGIVSTIAGNGTAGYLADSVAATSTRLNVPAGIIADGDGNIFIADMNNHRVRKVDNAGIITTVAGNGTMGFSGDGGAGTSAQLRYPVALAFNATGELIISDGGNNRLRKLTASGIISTIAGGGSSLGDGGPATSANLSWPRFITSDTSGNIYIADELHHRVRKINTSGIISTVAGNGTMGSAGDGGPATSATLNEPSGICTDSLGNLYIVEFHAHKIRKVDASGIITTFAGTGTAGYSGDGGSALAAKLDMPLGIVRRPGNKFYIPEHNNHVIRLISPSTTGINDAAYTAALPVSIFPNPTNASFTLRIGAVSVPQAQVVITNVIGVKVREMTVPVNADSHITLAAAPGMYNVTVSAGSAVSTTQLIIQ